MASSSNTQQAPTVLKNTLRFIWKSAADLPERTSFGKDILLGALGLKCEDLLCLQKNVKDRFFDVTFYTITKLEECKGLSDRLADGPLKDFQVRSLCRTGERIITVHMYNPWITTEATVFFLSKYAAAIDFLGPVRDSLGLWTGKRQFKVVLKNDQTGYDGFCHPPATFSIGSSRGYLFYAGQPKYCRKCATYGHLAEACNQTRCRNCNELGHTMGECRQQKRCNLCGEVGHLFKTCPKAAPSYAHVARHKPVTRGPSENDITSSSLRALEDVFAELVKDQEGETSTAGTIDVVMPLEEGGATEENMTGDWVTVMEKRRKGKGKRKRDGATSLPSLTPLSEANKFGALCPEEEEERPDISDGEQLPKRKEEMGTTNDTSSIVAAPRELEPSEAEPSEPEELPPQPDVATPSSYSLPPSGNSGDSIALSLSDSDNPLPPGLELSLLENDLG